MEANVHSSLNAEGWPALLSLEGACRYLSLELSLFSAVAERWNVQPVELGGGAYLWRRHDLDLLIKRLPSAGQWFADAKQPKALRLDAMTIEAIGQAVAARMATLQNKAPFEPRQLLSIREAGLQLGLSRSKIYTMIGEGILDVRKIGRRTLVTHASLARCISG